MHDGQTLLAFIDDQKKSKKRISEELGMSRSNLYQIFGSQTLTPDSKQKFEDYFGQKIFTSQGSHTASTQVSNKNVDVSNRIPYKNTGGEISKDILISQLFDRIKSLEADKIALNNDKEFIHKIYGEKLDRLEFNLNEISSNQTGLIAMLKESIKRAALYQYGNDKKKLAQEFEEINKIVADALR